MAYVEYRYSVSNSAYGATNEAISTLRVLAPQAGTDAQAVAQYIAFLCYCFPGDGTSVTAVTRRASTSAGATPLSWSQAEWDDLVALDGALPSLAGFGEAIGSGQLAAWGIGLTISLYSATPGRHNTGRTYSPYVKESALNSVGLVDSATANTCEDGYGAYVLGNGTNAAAIDLQPVVHSATNGDHLIVTPKVSIRPSRLKTRTR